MEEFTQSVKATLYERAKKPFTGTFVLAWVAYNWKFLVAIFFIDEEHLKGITRIEYIENLQLLGINNLLWKPFGIAMVAIIFLGALNVIASWIALQFKNFQFTYVDKRIKVDSADHGKLLDELRNIKDKWANEIESINIDRSKLIKSNEEFKNSNDIIKVELRETKVKLSDCQESINSLTLKTREYDGVLNNASELLHRYHRKHGAIKNTRTIQEIIDSPWGSKPTDETIKYIESLYDKYIS